MSLRRVAPSDAPACKQFPKRKSDALYTRVAAGVRVPQPYGYFNDTLIMEQPSAPSQGLPQRKSRGASIPSVIFSDSE